MDSDQAQERQLERDLQAKLRAMLKEAKEQGLIRDFALRPGGRATIYNVGERTKIYTTSTLDTMAALRKRGFNP